LLLGEANSNRFFVVELSYGGVIHQESVGKQKPIGFSFGIYAKNVEQYEIRQRRPRGK
jgi:hypothetical protein